MENHNVVPLMGIESLRDYVRLERKAKNIILRVLSERPFNSEMHQGG
jgi:hypothetical protein